MNKITEGEYLDAITLIRLYHRQLENEIYESQNLKDLDRSEITMFNSSDNP